MQEQKLPGTNKIQILEYTKSLSLGKSCQSLLNYPSLTATVTSLVLDFAAALEVFY